MRRARESSSRPPALGDTPKGGLGTGTQRGSERKRSKFAQPGVRCHPARPDGSGGFAAVADRPRRDRGSFRFFGRAGRRCRPC